MYLSYTGLRVTDLDRSLRFYTELFGLKEIIRADVSYAGGGTAVLLRDPQSGQRLELNWYPKSSAYGGTYVTGEGLDHVAFYVDDVPAMLRKLKAYGVEQIPIDPKLAEPRPRTAPDWFLVQYVKDPDGNWVELYQHKEARRPYDPDRW